MRFGKCPKCGKKKYLTKHHKTPTKKVYLCGDCHDEEHGIEPNKAKRYGRTHQKYQPGTKRQHKKK